MKITREDGTSVGFEKWHALHKIAVCEMTSFIRKFELRSDACAAVSYSSVMQPTGEEEAHAAHVLCCW